MAVKDLKKMSAVQLREEEVRIRKGMMDLRFQHATGRLVNSSAPKASKKELARVLTQMNLMKKEA